MIKTNLHLNQNSKRKQPSVSKDVYEFIRDQSRSLNSVGTKGVFVYELILTVETQRSESFDLIDEMEERIDQDLCSFGTDTLVRSIEKIKKSDKKNNRIGIDTNSTDFDLELHIPTEFDEKILPDWGANHTIMQRVSEYIHCAYDSRYHRIQVKKDILKFLENDNKDANTEIGQAIISGDCTQYDVSDVHSELTDEDDDDVNIDEISTIAEWSDVKDDLKISEQYEALGYVFESSNKVNKGFVENVLESKMNLTAERYIDEKIDYFVENFDIDFSDDEDDEPENDKENENIDKKLRLAPSSIVRDVLVEMKGKNNWVNTMDVTDIINKNTSDDYGFKDILDIIEDESNTGKTSYILKDENGKIYAKAPYK